MAKIPVSHCKRAFHPPEVEPVCPCLRAKRAREFPTPAVRGRSRRSAFFAGRTVRLMCRCPSLGIIPLGALRLFPSSLKPRKAPCKLSESWSQQSEPVSRPPVYPSLKHQIQANFHACSEGPPRCNLEATAMPEIPPEPSVSSPISCRREGSRRFHLWPNHVRKSCR